MTEHLDGDEWPAVEDPYRRGYVFPPANIASSYTTVSTKALQDLPHYDIGDLGRAVLLTALTEPAAADWQGDDLDGHGLVKLDPEDLAGRLDADADEIAAAVQELSDRFLLISPEGQGDDVWQINPMVAFRGSAAAQRKVIDRLVEQRGGEFPVPPEPGAVLADTATGKTFRA
ncbi:hypothetical protein [Kitasatospora sp. NPDC088134]|uniref:hypothetical protein n=1 Tax=Kitasatospora sp. NPDC088134 TaxID=3364071 RepID=UPI00380CE136